MSYTDYFKDYSKDTKLNLSSLLKPNGSAGLTPKQIFGTAYASALSTQNVELSSYIKELAGNNLEESDIQGIKGAVSLMAMNNMYYRALHLTSEKEISTLPARLRMNFMGNPGIDKKDFEVYSLAVSVLNGCGMCIDSHVKQLKNHDLSTEGVQSIFKIASVISSANMAKFLSDN